MSRILVIESNISKDENSLSHYAQEKFIDKLKQNNSNDEFIYLDLNNEKEIHTVINSNNMSDFWNSKSDEYIELLNSADKLIITSSMVNFSISPTLKQWFDKILVANKTFKYKYTDGKNHSVGLIKPGKKAQLILAQGSSKGCYPFSNFDNYIEGVLNFIGITDVSTLLFDGTKEQNQINLNNDEKFKLKEDEFKIAVNKF